MIIQGEFKILTGDRETVQKTLNQWRRQFHLMIYGFNADSEYTVLVSRVPLLPDVLEDDKR